MNVTVGEGAMFEEFESESESRCQNKSTLDASVRDFGPLNIVTSESISFPAVAAPAETNFDVMVSDFNKMIVSAYSLSSSPNDCFKSQIEITNDDELIKAMEENEKKTPMIEETERVNISDNDTLREVQIGLTLNSHEKAELIATLKEYRDVFAWSYEDMPGIDSDIAQYTIPLTPGAKPGKQGRGKLKKKNSSRRREGRRKEKEEKRKKENQMTDVFQHRPARSLGPTTLENQISYFLFR